MSVSRARSRVAAFANDKTRMAASLLLILTIASFGGALHRLLELACHFRVQYFVVGIILTIVLVVFRDWRWLGVASVCAIANGALVLPWFFGGPSRELRERADPSTFRVILSNVLTDNRNSESVLELIRREQPDLVVLQEIDDHWAEALRPLDDILPHSTVIPRADNFGIGLWSRNAPDEIEEMGFGEYEVPEIRARLSMGGRQVEIMAVHPVPPVGAGGFQERNAQLADVAVRVRKCPVPVVVLGDLNVTMWSPNYRRFIRDTKLTNARQGFGILPTWPTWPTWLSAMKIPLDHCLVSPGITVKGIRVGGPVGSDHLPVIVDLLPGF